MKKFKTTILFLVICFNYSIAQTAEEFYKLGVKQTADSSLVEANKSLNQAIKLDKKNATYLYARGKVRELRHKFDAAIHDFTKAIKINPNFAMAYYSRGHSFSVHGDFKQAIDDFNKAIRLNPMYEEAYIDLAVTNVLHHDEKEGAHDLEMMFAKIDKYKDPAFNKGAARMKMADMVGCCQEWKKAGLKSQKDAEHLSLVFCH
jgi:tetratricopeptide (TPR) repeat protein